MSSHFHELLKGAVATVNGTDLCGETLSFRGNGLAASVRRNPNALPQYRGKLRFEERETSEVHVMKERLTTAPVAGETMVDEFGKTHRVSKITDFGTYWSLNCIVSA